jgi:hypothetical protein
MTKGPSEGSTTGSSSPAFREVRNEDTACRGDAKCLNNAN